MCTQYWVSFGSVRAVFELCPIRAHRTQIIAFNIFSTVRWQNIPMPCSAVPSGKCLLAFAVLMYLTPSRIPGYACMVPRCAGTEVVRLDLLRRKCVSSSLSASLVLRDVLWQYSSLEHTRSTTLWASSVRDAGTSGPRHSFATTRMRSWRRKRLP